MAPKNQKSVVTGEERSKVMDCEMEDLRQERGEEQGEDVVRRSGNNENEFVQRRSNTNNTMGTNEIERSGGGSRSGLVGMQPPTQTNENRRMEGNEEERSLVQSKKVVRKRSRVNDRDEKDIGNDAGRGQTEKYEVQLTMKQLKNLIKSRGDNQRVEECFSTLAVQILELTAAIANLQEEKMILQEQIIYLQQASQSGIISRGTSGQNTQTYAQTAQKGLAKAVAAGVCLPPPMLPETTRHAPSEHVILYKAETKGVLPTRMEQEAFRENIKKITSNDCISEINAIRATRHGGYTIIFRSEMGRDKAMHRIETCTEAIWGEGKEQRIIAPKKKVAKIVCREPPENYTHLQILADFYGRHNPMLAQVAKSQRMAKIYETRLGWVFELSSQEAASVEAQGNRVRYGYRREMRMEEFIPLQQCYRCCLFGHNARDCNSEQEHCRLCGAQGHSGKDCNFKDERKMWKCVNYIWNNNNRDTRLPEDHAAAQLHRCAIAQNEKAIRKSQLATAGVFTTPQKHFVPQGSENSEGGNSSQQVVTSINKEDSQSTAISGNNSTMSTMGGAATGARRRTPSLQFARCYVPPASSSVSTTNGNPNRNNKLLQLRPAGPPMWKTGQQTRGRMVSRGIVGRGRGRESSEPGSRISSQESPTQQQLSSTSSSSSSTAPPNYGRASNGQNNGSMTMGNGST